jgi:hypothetical protein
VAAFACDGRTDREPPDQAPPDDVLVDVPGAVDGTDALSVDGGETGEVQAAIDAPTEASCSTHVGDPLTEHACIHARSGPFVDGEAPFAAERTHVTYRLRLARDAAGGYEGDLSFRSGRGGAHAFFTGSRSTIRAIEPPVRSPIAAHETRGCAELSWVSSFTLLAGDHIFRITSPSEEVTLVVERLDDWERDEAYRVDCASGTNSD